MGDRSSTPLALEVVLHGQSKVVLLEFYQESHVFRKDS